MKKADRQPMRSHEGLVWWGVLLLGLLVFYWPLLSGQKFIWFDFLNQHIPRNAYIAESLARGHLPQWDVTVYGGAPFLAEPENAVFYPFTWLLTLGVHDGRLAPNALQHLVLIETLFAALCMVLVIRELGGSRRAGVFAALAFCLSTPFVCRMMNYGHFTVIACIPLVLYGLFRWARMRTFGSVLLAGVCLGLAFLGGNPQYSYFLVIVCIVHCLCMATGMLRSAAGVRATMLLILGYAAICLIGILIAAVNILPTAEYAGIATRSIPAASGTPLKYFLTYIIPRFFGNVAGGPAPYWGEDGFWNYWEFSQYVGILPLVLAALSPFFLRGQRQYGFMLTLIVFAWVYAYGHENPLPRLLPFGASLRTPAKFLIFAAFSFSVIAGLTLDRFLTCVTPPRAARTILLGLVAVGVCVLMFGLIWEPHIVQAMFADAQRSSQRTGVQLAGVLLAASSALLLLIPVLKNSLPTAGVVSLPFILLMTDALYFNRGFNGSTFGPREVYPEVPAIAQLRAAADRAHLRCDGGDFCAGNLRARHYGLQTIDGFSAILARNVDAVRAVRGLDRERFNDLYSVAFVLSNQGIIQRTNYLPRAFVVRRTRAVAATNLVAELSAPTFNPRAEALVTDVPDTVYGDGQTHAQDAVSVTAFAPERIEVATTLAQPALLVLSENALPGWRVTVNGSAATPLMVNGCFRAVAVPAGNAVVVWTYLTPGLTLGGTITTVTVLAAAGVGVMLVRRRRTL